MKSQNESTKFKLVPYNKPLEGLQVDALLVMKTLSMTPRPLYCWKAEDLSFLYVLLVWGVKLVSS